MGFFDKVRDVLTGSDAGRAEKAQQSADKATTSYRETADKARAGYQKAVQKARDGEAKAREKAQELRRRAGLADDPTTDEDAAQAEAEAEQASAEARRTEADAAEKAEEKTEKKAQKAAEKQVDATVEKAEAGGEYRTVTVQPGDSLPALAARYGVGAEEMARLNNLDNPDLIYPGQVFKVPHA